MCLSTHRHSLHCILPPYILSKIAENGSPALRAMAMHSLMIDPTIRIVRASTAGPVTGDLARRRSAAGNILVPSPLRTIRDAGGEPEAPGPVVVRREGEGPTGDIAVDEAYDGLGATFALFWESYQRNSIDDAGLPLDATVHYDQDYDNAFWDGAQMVFGDGDGELFNRFTIALDVIGHELTHGVTEKEAGLAYFNQSGALNESISDVFGSLVKQKLLGQTADQADWLIGAGLLTSAVNGVALRSMKEPGTAYDDPVLGKDPQPGHMDDLSAPIRTMAGCTSIQVSPTGPSTWSRRRSAETHGTVPVGYGTVRCWTPVRGPTRTLPALPASPSTSRGVCTAQTAPRRQPSPRHGQRLE